MLHLIKSLIRSLGAAGRSAGTTAHGERVAQPAAARRETIALNATAIQEAINDFRALGDDESLDELCARRRELAAFILQTPTTSLREVWSGSLPEVWSASLRPLHGLIMHSGVRELPRSADDQQVLDDLRVRIVGRQRGEVDAAALLGAFMFAYSHEVPLPANLSDVPGWLRAEPWQGEGSYASRGFPLQSGSVSSLKSMSVVYDTEPHAVHFSCLVGSAIGWISS